MKAGKAFSGPCPCGSHLSYLLCCKPLHNGTAATAAESLMRSRYSAYALKLEDYLLSTWHPSTRPAGIFDAEPPRRWVGLKVLAHETQSEVAAAVEFVARYRSAGRAREIREKSRFVREDGRWLYLDWEISEDSGVSP